MTRYQQLKKRFNRVCALQRQHLDRNETYKFWQGNTLALTIAQEMFNTPLEAKDVYLTTK